MNQDLIMDSIDQKLKIIDIKIDKIQRSLDILIASLSEDEDAEYNFDLDGNLIPADRDENQTL